MNDERRKALRTLLDDVQAMGDVNVKTIWKFPLDITDRQTIQMPQGAQVLCVQMELATTHGVPSILYMRDTPCLWALIDKTHAPEPRTFTMHGLGDVDEREHYIGSFQHGAPMLHIFEVIHEPA